MPLTSVIFCLSFGLPKMSPKLGMGLYIVLTPALLSSCFTCFDMPFMYGIQDRCLSCMEYKLELVWKMNFSGYPLTALTLAQHAPFLAVFY
jgi:hypothetical protein